MSAELESIECQIRELKKERTRLRRSLPGEPVQDFELVDGSGPVHLSALFAGKKDLIVLHNMGKGCVYCTLWADGVAGFHKHIVDRTAFALVSPDEPSVQKEFADSRGWPFRMVSDQTHEFSAALDMVHDGDLMPGVSAFRLADDGSIVRVSYTNLGPGDDFCAVWPLFDLLEGGAGDWEPKYTY